MRYVYSVVRFVPDPARGEYVNLGAIVGSEESGEWDLRLVSNLRRARLFDEERALPLVLEAIGRVEEDIHPTADGETADLTEDWLTRLANDHRHVLQFTAPTPMRASTARAALDVLFEELIVDPARTGWDFLTKHRALAATRLAYAKLRVPKDALAEKVRVSAAGYRTKFDFALHNGRVLNLTQSWSFQLPSQDELAEEVLAWAWVVRSLRNGDGVAILGDREAQIDRDTPIGVVYIAPEGKQPTVAYGEAIKAFRETEVHAVPLERADEVVQQGSERFAGGAARR